MARRPQPWWWETRKRWAVQIDGTRYTEPEGISQDDLTGMAAWWEKLNLSLGRGESMAGGLTVGELARRYVEWDRARVEAGKRDAEAHTKMHSKLKRICRSSVARLEVQHWRADKFKSKQYESLLASWDAKFSAGYVRALASALTTVFRWATKEGQGLLKANPLAGAAVPPEPMAEERFAARAEAAAWLRWLRKTGQSRDYILLQRCLIHTGARPSEWTRSTVGEIDVKQWQIVRRKWKNAAKKRKARRIFIPMRLRRSILRKADFMLAPPESLLFRAPRGGRWSQSGLSSTTTYLRDKAIEDGVPLKDVGADRLTCYRWRHTAASELLMRGVDVATVAELLGTSPTQITKTYGHILSSHLAKAAEKLAHRR